LSEAPAVHSDPLTGNITAAVTYKECNRVGDILRLAHKTERAATIQSTHLGHASGKIDEATPHIANAIAAPMPRLLPVISAVRPLNSDTADSPSRLTAPIENGDQHDLMSGECSNATCAAQVD
jgi:hypothetical protein